MTQLAPRDFPRPSLSCYAGPDYTRWHAYKIMHDNPWWNLWRTRWFAQCINCGEFRYVRQ